MASGFSFGGKPAAPAFNQTGFGAQPTGSITFGTPVSSNPTPFGVAQPTTGFGSTNFNMSSFGTPATTTQTTGLAFGTPAASTPGFSFGSTPAPSVPSTGLTFGTPASTAPIANTSFGFSAPATAATGLTFGAPAVTSSTGFSSGLFGTPAATTPSLGFGTASTGLNLGQTQATTSSGGLFGGTNFSFGTPTTTTISTLNSAFGTMVTTAAPTFNLTTPINAVSTGLNFGLGTSTQPSGLSFGLGGTTTALNLSKPITTTTSATQPSFGLGGIVQATPKSGTSTTGKPDILPRDQQLPNELLQTVENFKNIVKDQKDSSSDVSRTSVKEFKKVTTKIDQVGNLLIEVEKQLQNNRALADKLKMDTAKGLQHVEMAQRTMDMPPGLQYENVMPLMFFKELVDIFEKEMQNLRLQIETTDKYVKNLGTPVPLSSQDLAVGMKKLHDTFVALAGRLQAVHSQVENQKEQYLNFRKFMLNDETNIFEIRKDRTNFLNILNNTNFKPPTIASGPSPFSTLNTPNIIQAVNQNQPQTTIPNTGFNANQQTPVAQTGTTSLFGNPTASLNTSFGQNSSLQFNSPSSSGFQLQKPPSGNKRGKQII